ncbi:MAG: cyclic nucleotide-binding domain-containing protein [Candidatus Hydrogenedens sp.]|nr:cyclic nucleotide-binding domain-containing protein [Candidatus Hydrogenedens sp.]
MLRWKSKSEDSAPQRDAAAPSGAGEQAPAMPNLAQLLVTEGQLSAEQVQAAVAKQKETGQFIGEILIELGYIEEHSLISFLAKHCKIPHLSLLDYLIDKDIVSLVPKEICLQYRLLPIDRLGRNLTVAMVNPLDMNALQKVREVCPDLRIKPILCAYKHFELVTGKVFASKDGGPAEMSASSFGLRLTPEEKARIDAQRAAAKAAAPAPAPAPAPEPEPEPAPAPAPEPAPEPEPEPVAVAKPAPEESPFGEADAPPEPAPTPPPVAAVVESQHDSMFDSIFANSDENQESAQEPPEEEPAPAPAADSGASALMREMANVMMDSMRGTYAVLARRMELFRDLQAEDVAKIFSRGITREVQQGEIVFSKGDAGDALYCVLGGEIEIFDGDRVIATLGRGEMFGEMALMSEEPRSASARATETSSLLALNRDIVHNIMPRDVSVQLLVNIIIILSARLRAANDRG